MRMQRVHITDNNSVYRFAILAKGCRTRDPDAACLMISTCFFLHNLATRQRDIIDPLAAHHESSRAPIVVRGQDTQDGADVRDKIVRNHFCTLSFTAMYNMYKLAMKSTKHLTQFDIQRSPNVLFNLQRIEVRTSSSSARKHA